MNGVLEVLTENEGKLCNSKGEEYKWERVWPELITGCSDDNEAYHKHVHDNIQSRKPCWADAVLIGKHVNNPPCEGVHSRVTSVVYFRRETPEETKKKEVLSSPYEERPDAFGF